MKHKHESTAYHEAGHAVAAVVLRLKIGRRGVSIVPDREKDLVGVAHVLVQLRERPDCAVSTRTRAHLESQAIMRFAGDAAERKFNGRRRFRGHSDYSNACDLLEYISTSLEQCEARLKVAYVGAQDLIEDNWPSVQAVAGELLRKRTLRADEVAKLVLPQLLAA